MRRCGRERRRCRRKRAGTIPTSGARLCSSGIRPHSIGPISRKVVRTWCPADGLGKLIRIDLDRVPIVRNVSTRSYIEAAQVLKDMPNLMQEDVREFVLAE